MFELNQQIVFSVKHCHFFFLQGFFHWQGVSKGRRDFQWTDQSTAETVLCYSFGGPLFLSAMDADHFHANWISYKEASFNCAFITCKKNPTRSQRLTSLKGNTSFSHVLSEDALQHLQQHFGDVESMSMYWAPHAEGCSKKGVGTTWAKLSEALLVFLFSLGPKTDTSWLGQSRTPLGYLPYLFLLLCGYKTAKQPTCVFFLEQLKFSAI